MNLHAGMYSVLRRHNQMPRWKVQLSLSALSNTLKWMEATHAALCSAFYSVPEICSVEASGRDWYLPLSYRGDKQ